MARSLNDMFSMPNLPTIPTTGDVMSTLGSIGNLPGMTSTALPEARNLLGQSSQYLMPEIEGIRERTGQLAAGAQTDAMRRGLTGSDIEAANIRSINQGGLKQEGAMRADFARQNAQFLSELIFRANQGDITAATNLRQLLAQAMGEDIGRRDTQSMFNQQMKSAGQDRIMGMVNSLIGAGGAIGGAILGGPPGAAAGGALAKGLGGKVLPGISAPGELMSFSARR